MNNEQRTTNSPPTTPILLFPYSNQAHLASHLYNVSNANYTPSLPFNIQICFPVISCHNDTSLTFLPYDIPLFSCHTFDSQCNPAPPPKTSERGPASSNKGGGSAMASQATNTPLADVTDVSCKFYLYDQGTKYTPRHVKQCIDQDPSAKIYDLSPFLDTDPKNQKAFSGEVKQFLQMGMHPGCRLLNPRGDGNCLIYALVLTLGDTMLTGLDCDWYEDLHDKKISNEKTVAQLAPQDAIHIERPHQWKPDESSTCYI